MRMLRRLSAALALAMTAGAATAAEPFIASVYVNSPGTDQGNETLGLAGDPGASLNNYWFVILESETSSSAGSVDAVINLSSYTLGANGLLLIRDSAAVLQPPPAPGTTVVVRDFSPDIENSATTFILVRGNPGVGVGDDLDTDDDGTIDVTIAGTVVDAVGYQDGDAGGLSYADDFGGIDYGQLPFYTPDAVYRIVDSAGDPSLFIVGDVLGTSPGPFAWEAAENLGWSLIGVNPSSRNLELGRPNYAVDEYISVDLPRGSVTINGLPQDLGGMVVDLSTDGAGQPGFLGSSTFRGLAIESLLPPPSWWWTNVMTNYHMQGFILPPELFAARGATATITIDLGSYGSLVDQATSLRGGAGGMVIRHTFSGSLTLPTTGTVSFPIEKRDMQVTFNPGGTGSGSYTLAATVDGVAVTIPVSFTISYSSPTPIAQPLSFTGSAAITAYDDFTGDYTGTAIRAAASAPCPADLNGDGIVDFTDYLEFLNLYDALDPRVDFNMDGIVDFGDYLEFLNLFDAGC